MKTDKIVLRFKDKTLLKGHAKDFSPGKKIFHMRLLNGETVMVDVEKLKAVFFVKRFEGDKDYRYRYKDALPWGGTRMKVKFSDGEVMIGYTQHHQIIDDGFFMTSADIKGNNTCVYIIKSSTHQVSYL
ncbi:MAG: hypothetical protein JSV11_09050 [Nitrospiraceae bacterium]|nr:MAG: hypothetical protein JSV11_09050 [Nitrospiraceae bacterium]